MQEGRIVLGERQTIGLRLRLRLLTLPQGLCGIPQAPQRVGQHDQAPHSSRGATGERLGVQRRGVEEGDPLRTVHPGGGIVTQVEQGRPERIMRLQAMHRVGPTLGQPEELFPELHRGRECPPVPIEPP